MLFHNTNTGAKSTGQVPGNRGDRATSPDETGQGHYYSESQWSEAIAWTFLLKIKFRQLFLADRAEQEKDSQRTKTEKVQAFLCSEVIYQTQAAVASDGHRVV